MEKYGHLHKYIGFIDSDEYIVLAGRYAGDTLDSFLLRFGDAPGVALNWYLVGSVEPIRRPSGLTGCNFVDCVPNRLVKSFCRSKFTARQKSVHECRFAPEYDDLKLQSVSVLGRNMSGPSNPHFAEHPAEYDAYLYHYVVKSFDDFVLKNTRGSGVGRYKSFSYYLDATAVFAQGVGHCRTVRSMMTRHGLCAGAGNYTIVPPDELRQRLQEESWSSLAQSRPGRIVIHGSIRHFYNITGTRMAQLITRTALNSGRGTQNSGASETARPSVTTITTTTSTM